MCENIFSMDTVVLEIYFAHPKAGFNRIERSALSIQDKSFSNRNDSYLQIGIITIQY